MIKKSPGWFTYHKKLHAMFEGDPQVQVNNLSDHGKGKYSVEVVVNEPQKAEVLRKLLLKNIRFGNITVAITVLNSSESKCCCDNDDDSVVQLYQKALSGNKAFIKTETIVLPLLTLDYCILERTVVQFNDDDLTDYYGNWSGLFRDIAKEIFNTKEYRINFSTNIA